MVKKRIEDRICRDCGKLIIGRRSDAIVCKDCRRKAQGESAQKIKEKDKEKRFLEKVEERGVKIEIEYKKVREIVENLEKGPEEDIDAKIKEYSNPLNLTFLKAPKFPPDPFKVSETAEDIKSGRMKPIWEMIDKKVKEKLDEEEIKKKKEEEKLRNPWRDFS